MMRFSDIINHEDGIRRETILEYSEKYQVCPFEFQLDISLWCDVIIGIITMYLIRSFI